MLLQFFIGQSWIGVFGYMDDAAECKAVFFQEVLHDIIIFVRVHAQVMALFIGPADAEASGAFDGPEIQAKWKRMWGRTDS